MGRVSKVSLKGVYTGNLYAVAMYRSTELHNVYGVWCGREEEAVERVEPAGLAIVE